MIYTLILLLFGIYLGQEMSIPNVKNIVMIITANFREVVKDDPTYRSVYESFTSYFKTEK